MQSNELRGVVEAVLNDKRQKLSYEEAIKATSEMLLSTGLDVRSIIDQIEVEYKEKVYSRTKLTEVGTSRLKDLREVGWYPGVDSTDGVWARLRDRMLESGLASAVNQINNSTEEIMASIAEPGVDHDRRLGLVIGNVQSGKTANYSAVVAKALDSRYRFVLILSGVHNNLRKQTQQRLDRDLGVSADPRDWYRLTDADGDFGTAHIANASAIVAGHERILAVVKKNSGRLRNVLSFLRKLDEQVKRNTPFLIIDDESDQATPDASPGVDDDPTAINGLMREIWGEIRNGTYIGYTATPFANIFMDPNSSDRGNLEELYPRDFVHVMPTPQEYFGAERIFGLSSSDEENGTRDVPDVVRHIPLDEVRELSPKMKDPSASQFVTKSLGDSIRWFIVAAAVRRMRGQNDKHSTMLIHTTHRVDPHFAMREAVEEYLEPLKKSAREGEVDSFRKVFHEEIDRAAELYQGNGPAPTWPRISEEIPNVLRNLRVAVDNGRAEDSDRLSYSDDQPQTVIVIGGGTLSRGLTLEGLFVSFFTRTSNTYDTLLQMGRWFGYRKGYDDLQRIWLSPGLDSDYRFLATVEADLREEITRMTASKQTPAEIGIRVRQHPGRLQITSPAKMKHTDKVAVDFEGFRLQTTVFDVSSESVLTSNARLTESLLEKISTYRSDRSERLFEDVPLSELMDFFSGFKVHKRFAKDFREAVKWSEGKLPAKRWNVVVSAGKAKDEALHAAGDEYGAIRRSPIRFSSGTRPEEDEVNLRALMSGQDIVADVALKGILPKPALATDKRMTNIEQFEWRRKSQGANGRGLLALYPVSRTAGEENSAVRMPMAEALEIINPELLAPGRPPIVGIGLIAPFDTENQVKEKGTRIAVQPVFDDAEELDEPSVYDSEEDFRGSE